MFLSRTQLTKNAWTWDSISPGTQKKEKRTEEVFCRKFHSRDLSDTPVRALNTNKANKSPSQWRYDLRRSLERPKWSSPLTRFSTRQMSPTIQQQVHTLTVVSTPSAGTQYNHPKRCSGLSTAMIPPPIPIFWVPRSSKLTGIDNCQNWLSCMVQYRYQHRVLMLKFGSKLDLVLRLWWFIVNSIRRDFTCQTVKMKSLITSATNERRSVKYRT